MLQRWLQLVLAKCLNAVRVIRCQWTFKALSSLSTFSFITELARHLRRNNADEHEDDDIKQFLPQLLYVLRDFHADLEDEGEQITPDDYLEKMLQVEVSPTYYTSVYDEATRRIYLL